MMAARTNASRISSISARVSAAGTWLMGAYRIADGPTTGQFAVVERLVHPLPHEFRRTFRTGMSELQTDLCLRIRMHELDDAPPCGRVLGQIHAGAAGRDAAVLRDARHLGEHEAGAAERARSQMDEMEIVGHSVDRAVHIHGRDDNAVAQLEAAQAKRREHRWDLHPTGEPALDSLDVRGIAQAQVFVTDALAARQQAVRELLGREDGVASDVFEPLGRIARRVLKFEHLDAPRCLVFRQRLLDISIAGGERVGQADRIFHRQFRARTDRKVRGVRGVAHEHDVFVYPALVADAREVQPFPSAQVRGVGHQAVAAQIRRKERFAKRNRLARSRRYPIRARARSLRGIRR